MASLNKVLLIGNLTRDPEMRYIPSGTAITKFGLAVNRDYTDRTSGDKKESVCFVNIVAWGKVAEICNQYLSKGRPVFIEGRLEFSQWETKEGEKRSKLEVTAERVQFLGAPPAKDEQQEKLATQTPVTESSKLPITATKEEVEAERKAKGLPIAGPADMESDPSF